MSHQDSRSHYPSLHSRASSFKMENIQPLNMVDLSCGAKCLKLLLLIFNTIFWFSGLLLFSLGIFVLIEDERSLQYKLFTTGSSAYALQQYLAMVFIGIGVSIFVIGFCGCCGALMDSRPMLLGYAVFLILVFVAELTVGILAVVFQERARAEIKLNMVHKLRNNYGENSAFTAAIDLVQSKYKCCGIYGPDDYSNSRWRKYDNYASLNVSMSCCVLKNEHEREAFMNPIPIERGVTCQNPPDTRNPYARHNTGCETALELFIRRDSLIFIIIGCGLAGMMLFGFIITFGLFRSLPSPRRPQTDDS